MQSLEPLCVDSRCLKGAPSTIEEINGVRTRGVRRRRRCKDIALKRLKSHTRQCESASWGKKIKKMKPFGRSRKSLTPPSRKREKESAKLQNGSVF